MSDRDGLVELVAKVFYSARGHYGGDWEERTESTRDAYRQGALEAIAAVLPEGSVVIDRDRAERLDRFLRADRAMDLLLDDETTDAGADLAVVLTEYWAAKESVLDGDLDPLGIGGGS